MAEETIIRIDQFTGQAKVIKVVLDSLASEHSRRAYERALKDFLYWHEENGRPPLNKAVVQSYVANLRDSGLSPSSINQRLAAIRKLVSEAADNGGLDQQTASVIRSVKGVRQEGRRAGNWLTKQQAQEILNATDLSSLKGVRDRAILALLIGCGLRRTEAAKMEISHIQQREGRWVIIDLIGKRNKIRSVPMPNWAKAAIDEWLRLVGIRKGKIFLSINKGGRVYGEGMTPQAIRDIVVEYAEKIGVEVAPHDLRRTFAKLAHKGGAALEQIQLSLGHSSIKTTEVYLGVDQDLTNAPCDYLGLKLD
ncbi:MAG: tyrosine-type recombinase/integrase [Acidobacteriota bacterium]